MTHLNHQEAQELLKRLHQYPAYNWSYDVNERKLKLRTRTGANIEIEHRFWPDWSDEGFGQYREQFRLQIDGSDIGAIDESGKKRELWDVVNLGDFFNSIVENPSVQEKLAEATLKKEKFNEEIRVKAQERSRALLEAV